MAIVAISKSACPKGRGGIAKLWATECENIATITFDASHDITALTMVAVTTFKLIEFEKNTAFFNQEKTRVGNSHDVQQTIQFILPNADSTQRLGIYELNQPCCIAGIVKLNSGEYLFAGITYDPVADEYEFEDMAAGDGSWNTGADPAADKNELIENLIANVGFYAPVWTLAEAGIPV